jgi:hypothetical protein
MAARRDDEGTVDQPPRRRLVARALGAVGEPVAAAARETGDDGRLGEPLQVEDGVVVLAAKPSHERPDLAPRGRAPGRPAPPPQGQLDDLGDAGNAADDRRERGFGHPVDARVGVQAPDVGDDGQRVHDVAQRRELDDEDARRPWRRRRSRRGHGLLRAASARPPRSARPA